MKTYFKAGYFLGSTRYSDGEIEMVNIEEGNRVYINFSEEDEGKSRILVFKFSDTFISLFETREKFIKVRDAMIVNLNRSYTPNEFSELMREEE